MAKVTRYFFSVMCVFVLFFVGYSMFTNYQLFRRRYTPLMSEEDTRRFQSKFKPEIKGNESDRKPKTNTKIAVVMGISTRTGKPALNSWNKLLASFRMKAVKPQYTFEDFLHVILEVSLPSFCSSIATQGYDYHFFLGFDYDDKVVQNEKFGTKFLQIISTTIDRHCSPAGTITIRLVNCSHSHKPAWIQNDASVEAYLEGMDFIYRINDDTKFLTNDWEKNFIRTLNNYKPPNIGVVGPTHTGGNTKLLTYEFVHRSHMDIFGFHYPRIFSDWYGDEWISSVYQHEKKYTKHPSVKVEHLKIWNRYNVTSLAESQRKFIVDAGAEFLKHLVKKRLNGARIRSKMNYLNAHSDKVKKLIVMTVSKLEPRYLLGAVRNAQLMIAMYPAWRLRVYIPEPCWNRTRIFIDKYIQTLHRLDAEVILVHCKSPVKSIHLWSLLAFDDGRYEHIIIRSPLYRFSEKEANFVNQWIRSRNSFHIIRDTVHHPEVVIVPGLWGTKRKYLVERLSQKCQSSWDIQNITNSVVSIFKATSEQGFMDFLYSLVKEDSFYNDVKFGEFDMRPILEKFGGNFPAEFMYKNIVGQMFDEHMNAI